MDKKSLQTTKYGGIMTSTLLALLLGLVMAGGTVMAQRTGYVAHTPISLTSKVGNGKTIKIGNIGWDEDVALNSVVKILLHQKYGYNVQLQLADVGPLYQGVASGSLDAFLDTWLPKTQAIYWARYKNQVIKLHPWYMGKAIICLGVPKYVKAKSIADLNKYRSQFGGKIVGIEPGAGEMNVVQTKVIPGYHLNYTLEASSTPAMLAALKRAIVHKQWIVVTAWQPHWMFTAYPLRCLSDPKKEMGGSEQLSAIVWKGFPKADPPAFNLINHVRLNAHQLGTLEFDINRAGNPDMGARVWLSKNQRVWRTWLK
jgi:glycine betaine/proline transport system substrate-binding protein